MSEGKVGAQSSVGAELSSKEKEKTGVLASSEEDCNTMHLLWGPLSFTQCILTLRAVK